MNLNDVIETCNNAIPLNKTWERVAGEAYGPCLNGHPLNEEIRKVLFCVTYSPVIESYAMHNGYDLIISHHPGMAKMMPHLVYHTALDCCRGGLNDMWADAIGMPVHGTFDGNLGAMGRVDSVSFDDLLAKCLRFAGWVEGCKQNRSKVISKIIICTGLGGMIAHDIEKFEPDCFITGELIQSPHSLNIPAIIEVGHTLSERCGIEMFEKILTPHKVIVDSAPIEMDRFGGEVFEGWKRNSQLTMQEATT